MILDQLTPLRSLLERARLTLAAREDAPARLLLVDVGNLLFVLARVELIDEEAAARRHVPDLAKRGSELVERVKAYCDAHRLRFVSIDTPTQVMSYREIWEAISEMRAGDTEPPPAVVAEIAEAQGLSVPLADALEDDAPTPTTTIERLEPK